MPNYTQIPTGFREEYKKKILETITDSEKIHKLSKEDPFIFAKYFLGVTLRLHQAYIMHRILTSKPKTEKLGKRIAMCIARQLGKSLGFCIFVIWACWYDKYPATMFNETIIYVTSRDDPASEDLIKKIRKTLSKGDRHMEQYGETEFFTSSLTTPNNNHEITFANNAYIGSFPPTLTALGKSCSWFFIDEAHRLRCTDTDPESFFDYASVIVAETGGNICLSSSAQGILGFFYRAIDPHDKNPKNEYDTLWFSHEIWDDDTEDCQKHKAFVESERIRLTEAGRFKFWQQEHMSLFTVTETAFFDHKDIDNSIKDTAQQYEWKSTPCSVAYDYGMTISRTVITIRTVIKGEIIEIFQYRCSAGFDNNKLREPEWEHSIQRLDKRYDLSMGIYADDCPNGDDNNKWMKEHMEHLHVYLYNFRSDQMAKTDGLNRNCVAYSYRAKLKKGILKIPKWNTIQQFEMKIVQETEQKVLISIKAPEGQLCDTFDSDMMACIPFLDMKDTRSFGCEIAKIEESEQDQNYPRYDKGLKKMTKEEQEQMLKDANDGLL